MMYLRFTFCLAFGLFGVVLFLMTAMDSLLVDWDVIADVKKWFTQLFQRKKTRYVHIEHSKTRAGKKKAIERQFLGGKGGVRTPRFGGVIILPSPSYLRS